MFMYTLLALLCLAHSVLGLADYPSAVQSLISRVTSRAKVGWAFTPILEFVPYEGEEFFEIDSTEKGEIVFRGSSGVALASAFGHYIRHYLHCDFHWERAGAYSMESFPKSLADMPVPSAKKRVQFLAEKRYYKNTCTESYSFVWSDWTSFEMEIDWMAMSGINLPLAFTGQEYVWAALWKKYGVTQEGLNEYFTGPAFLAWNRMANVRAWGGPLPQSWIDQQADLQRNILQRYQELGITPVLPAFNGVVPQQITTLYPQANITQLKTWATYSPFPAEDCCNFLLDSQDPLFAQIGADFMTLQQATYGQVTHYYNVDTFNENLPASNDPAYLQSMSSVVYSYMKAIDADAIWLMQAWTFVDNKAFWTDSTIAAYLSGVPDDRLVLLDLFAEEHPIWPTLVRLNKRFIWCMLHSFGGNRALYGNMSAIAVNPLHAMTAAGSLFVGTGLTMEAIDQNPVMYELMTEVAMADVTAASAPDSTGVDISQWVSEYALRRYNLKSAAPKQIEAADAAWKLLVANNYMRNSTTPCGGVGNIICPSFKAVMWLKPGINATQLMYLPAGPLAQVWELLSSVHATGTDTGTDTDSVANEAVSPPNSAYTYDLVDVGRQVIVNLFYDLFRLFQGAYARRDQESASFLGEKLMDMVADWDRLMATHADYLMGRWVSAARSWGTTQSESDLYEYNARNQVTLWGPSGQIDDYAAKNWAGLASEYYSKRWRLLVDMAVDSIRTGSSFNESLFDKLALQIGQQFCDSTQQLPSQPVGCSLEVTQELQSRYGNAYNSTSKYTVMPHTTVVSSDDYDDAYIYDYNLLPAPMWTDSVPQLAFLCDQEPACFGFDSAGMLKRRFPRKALRHNAVGVDLYLKQPLR